MSSSFKAVKHFDDHSKRITQLEDFQLQPIRYNPSKKTIAGGITTIVTVVALIILSIIERLPS